MFKFKDESGEDPIYSEEVYYDLFDGGYIKPDELLLHDSDKKLVKEAIETINQFLSNAVDNGVLEVG